MQNLCRNDPCFCGSRKKFKHCCVQSSGEMPGVFPIVAPIASPIPVLLEAAKKYRLDGKFQEALAHYDAILRLNPNEPDALHYSGVIAFQEEDYAKAEELVRRSLMANPANPSNSFFLVNLGLILKGQKKYHEAVECLAKAIALKPGNAFAFLNLGVTQVAMGLNDNAIANYHKAIALDPDFKEALYNLGIALRLKGDHLEAIQCNLRVIALDPGYIDAYINVAASNVVLKNFNVVAEYSLKAIKLNPNQYNPYYNLGVACHEQGNLEGSLVFLEKSLSLNLDYMNAHIARSLVMLAMGNLEQGWKGYESRWYKETQPEPMRHYPYPWWLGESLDDKTILVWGEQGIGDQMMFSSMLEELIPRAKKCIVACAKKLIPLFSRSYPTAHFIDLNDANHLASMHNDIDVQSALGSVARWLRPTIGHFPKKSHFLTPNEDRVAYWKSRLAGMEPKLNVGICWRSGNISGDRIFYCTEIDQWAPVFAVPGVRFINLQYDECSTELALAKQKFGTEIHAFNEVDLFDDIDETAALTKALDLVISAPTTVGILSALLGVPTWQMISGFNWQMMGTSENAWYTTLKTIHRKWDQPWEVILENIARLLESRVQENR